jgi:hypothetical protein
LNTSIDALPVGFAPLYPPYRSREFLPRIRPAGQVADLTPTVSKLQIPNPKRAQGFLPAEGLGVSPNPPNLPPRMGARGLKTSIDTVLCCQRSR